MTLPILYLGIKPIITFILLYNTTMALVLYLVIRVS
jgi:hypothetical protein